MSKKSGKNARRINKELLAKLKRRKETNKRWKQEQVVSHRNPEALSKHAGMWLKKSKPS